MGPLLLVLIPDSNLNFCSVLTHVDSLGQSKLNFYSDVSGNMSCRVRVWDIFQALLNSKDWSHVPLPSLLADLRILVHLKVNNSSYNVIILDLMRGKIVIACPESA